MCSMVEMKAGRTPVGQRRNCEETDDPRTGAWAAERKVWRIGVSEVKSRLLSLPIKMEGIQQVLM